MRFDKTYLDVLEVGFLAVLDVDIPLVLLLIVHQELLSIRRRAVTHTHEGTSRA